MKLAPLLALALAGCSGFDIAGALRSSGATSTPDEFAVQPTRPLELPQDLTALPEPTPGLPNRVDITSEGIAVAGLTGRETLATASGAPLVARVGRADPTIRTTLRAEDIEYRSHNRGRILERIFSRDREALVYRDMALDAPAEYDRLRNTGLRIPPPPPSVADPE